MFRSRHGSPQGSRPRDWRAAARARNWALMAERQGVRPEVLRAIFADDIAVMPDDVALSWRYTKALLAHDAAADDYRAVLLKRWGPRAVVTLAFAIAAARIYPTVKYAMGHGKACTRVVIGGIPVAI